MAYRVRQGRDFVTPPAGLTYTGSYVSLLIFVLTKNHLKFTRLLYQMFHLGEENYTPNPVLEKALDVLFLIHADHELNASTTTFLQTASSLANPYSAVACVPIFFYGCFPL